MGFMIQCFQIVCFDCSGEGEIICEKDCCKQCGGKKIIVDCKVFYVYVDKGICSGVKVEFCGEGDQVFGVQVGDVVFEIEQKEYFRFDCKDDDLFYFCEIDFVIVFVGGIIYIEYFDDCWLSVDILFGEVIL